MVRRNKDDHGTSIWKGNENKKGCTVVRLIDQLYEYIPKVKLSINNL